MSDHITLKIVEENFVTCRECERTWDLTNAKDANDYSDWHECEDK